MNQDDEARVSRFFARTYKLAADCGGRFTAVDLVQRALAHAVRIEARLPNTDRAQLGMQAVGWDIVRSARERRVSARTNPEIADMDRYRPHPIEIAEAFAIFR